VKRILIQKRKSQLYYDVVTVFEGHFELLCATAGNMGERLVDAQGSIDGILLFDLSEQSLRVCSLARNERFVNPTLPIAFVGDISTIFPMPFGCERFDSETIKELIQYFDNPTRIRALIVEDDTAILEVANLALSRYMDVETADDGNQASSRIEASKYDLVVLDVMLPGISGENVFELIRKKSPETAIVVMTAFDTEKVESFFTLKGAAAYIQKPFLNNSLFRQQCMNAILSHWNGNVANRLQKAKVSAERAHKEHARRMNRYV